MKRLLTSFFLVGVAMLAVPNVHAGQTKDFQGIYEECGIGGLLFPRWPIGASVSNVIWDWGTTASTSGLTTPDACKGGQAKLAMYIYKSYDSIEKNLAKGDGKYLDMLALLANKSSDQKSTFIQTVRAKFRDVVAKEGYSSLDRLAKAKIVYSIVQEQTQS